MKYLKRFNEDLSLDFLKTWIDVNKIVSPYPWEDVFKILKDSLVNIESNVDENLKFKMRVYYRGLYCRIANSRTKKEKHLTNGKLVLHGVIDYEHLDSLKYLDNKTEISIIIGKKNNAEGMRSALFQAEPPLTTHFDISEVTDEITETLDRLNDLGLNVKVAVSKHNSTLCNMSMRVETSEEGIFNREYGPNFKRTLDTDAGEIASIAISITPMPEAEFKKRKKW